MLTAKELKTIESNMVYTIATEALQIQVPWLFLIYLCTIHSLWSFSELLKLRAALLFRCFSYFISINTFHLNKITTLSQCSDIQKKQGMENICTIYCGMMSNNGHNFDLFYEIWLRFQAQYPNCNCLPTNAMSVFENTVESYFLCVTFSVTSIQR